MEKEWQFTQIDTAQKKGTDHPELVMKDYPLAATVAAHQNGRGYKLISKQSEVDHFTVRKM